MPNLPDCWSTSTCTMPETLIAFRTVNYLGFGVISALLLLLICLGIVILITSAANRDKMNISKEIFLGAGIGLALTFVAFGIFYTVTFF